MSEKPTMVAMAMISGSFEIARLSATSPGMFAANARSTTRKKNWNLRYRKSAMNTTSASEPSRRSRSISKRSMVSSGMLARVAASPTRTTREISRTRLLMKLKFMRSPDTDPSLFEAIIVEPQTQLGRAYEQGIHARRRRARRGDRSRAPGAPGAEELHHARGPRAPEIGVEGAGRDRATGAGEDRGLGRVQRRPLGKCRLPLREKTLARDRAPHPFSHEAPRDCRGRRSPGPRPGPCVLRRHRHLPRFRRPGARRQRRRHRRGGSRARPGVVGVADRPGAAQGAGGRHGNAQHAGRDESLEVLAIRYEELK